MKLKSICLATAAVVSLAATAVSAAELKFANFTPPFHTINASVIEKLNADLSAATNGELTVRGYHGGELGAGPVEQYVRVLQGAADIAWGLPGSRSRSRGCVTGSCGGKHRSFRPFTSSFIRCTAWPAAS